MPTTIATLGRERTVATLARRLYQIEGRGNTDLLRRAEAALLSANPRLSRPEGFRTGGRIVVPAVTGLERSPDVAASGADAQGLTGETTLRLQALGSRVEDTFQRAADLRAQTLQRLDDNKFVAEARKALPGSAAHIARSRDRLKQEEEGAAAAAERLQNAVSAALERLAILDARARTRA